nr:retrovirus-related Pol polyprotein from transposon TNT 1-94 [Tanacetum cinerariifolium]GEW89916.1 retrovirus-related Pol polyprotein from transposon TNT 1-94 [Tanacetum cinerariifolium]
MATLNSKEIKESSNAKGDDGEGLYVRGRTDRRDSRQSRGKSRSKSRGTGSARLDHGFRMLIPHDTQSGKVKVINGELNVSVEEKDSLAQVLEKEGLYGKKSLGKLDFCENYVLGKSHRASFGVGRHTTQGVIDYVHSDLRGPSQMESLGGLPKTFWAEATCTAAYLINRSPSRMIEKKTPIEMWSGHLSDYGMLRIFGCVAYPHDKQDKLEPRAVKCILLGYPKGAKGYRLYRLDDESPKIVTSRNVVFNESVMYKDTLKDSGACDKSVEELQVEVEPQRLNNDTPKEDQTDQEDGDDEDARNQATDQPPDLTDYQLVQDREPRTRTKPLRFRDESNMAAYAFVAVEEEDTHEPLTYQEAVACEDSSKWKAAMKEEMDSLKKNKTWELVDHPARQKLVSCKWLFKIKERIEDDMLIACKSKAEIGSTKSLLKKEFDMKELEEAKKILGMEIVRDRSHKILRVSQSGYVYKILNNFKIYNRKSVKMPLGGQFKLSLKDSPVRDCDVKRMSKVPYANAVGSLMYLMVCTRPDIAYAVSVVSRYLANPGKNHWEAVKWILKYFWGTANVGLMYGTNPGNHVDVTGFVDSDYAKDPDKGRFITGYAFLVQGCVVSWKATLQHVVALSTTEAEYMALTEAMKEAIWLRGLLEKLGVELNTVAVNCDNQDAIHLLRNHVFHERTKHINVRCHFIIEVLESKTVKVLKVGTKHNDADALMKVVP